MRRPSRDAVQRALRDLAILWQRPPPDPDVMTPRTCEVRGVGGGAEDGGLHDDDAAGGRVAQDPDHREWVCDYERTERRLAAKGWL